MVGMSTGFSSPDVLSRWFYVILHRNTTHYKNMLINLTLRHNWRQTRPPVLSCLPRNLCSVLSSLHFRCRAATARRAPQSCCPSWAKYSALSLLVAICCFCYFRSLIGIKILALSEVKFWDTKDNFVQLTFLRFSDEINLLSFFW